MGLIEWIPRSDPMVARMLARHCKRFDDYTEPAFWESLHRRAEIAEVADISETGRRLVHYRRRHG